MGSRSTFTDDEWHELQWAVMLAGSHVKASDWSGWWQRLQESTSGSRILTMKQDADNQLVADLARDRARRHPPDASDRASLAGDAALAHIRRATRLVADRAPEDLEPFKDLLLDVAEAVAASVDDVSEEEVAALVRIQDALERNAGAAPA